MSKLRQEFTASKGLHDWVQQKLDGISTDSAILDLGCGSGAFLDRLATAGYSNLTGLDKDIKLASGVSARLLEIDIDVLTESLPSSPFDVITSIEVLEHVENPGNYVKFLAANLASNGYAIITTPNIQSLESRLRFLLKGQIPFFDEKAEPTHIYPVYLQSFQKILDRHNLVMQDRWPYPENGSQLFRPLTRALRNVVGLLCSDDVPGDKLCMKISHREKR